MSLPNLPKTLHFGTVHLAEAEAPNRGPGNLARIESLPILPKE